MIQKYLDLYSDGIILSSGSTKNLAGNAFTFDEGADSSDGEGDTDDVLGPVISAPDVPPLTVTEIGSSTGTSAYPFQDGKRRRRPVCLRLLHQPRRHERPVGDGILS